MHVEIKAQSLAATIRTDDGEVVLQYSLENLGFECRVEKLLELVAETTRFIEEGPK